ncbi:MAG: DUF5995 family protein [Polyangiales bacterium]
MQAVSGAPCETYTQVVARLAAIEGALPYRDGIGWFNRLYKAMTEAVAQHAQQGTFKDPAFVELLDCVFAELYFTALRARLTTPKSEPRAWTPLFDARENRRISPLQFALAGVNAHINRDLAVALVTAFARGGGQPTRGDARHVDYLAVNRILGEVQAHAKSFLFTGMLVDIDALLGRSDDVLELWSLARARDAAWVAGEVQWQLRGSSFLADQHLSTLDQLVSCTGRGLLRAPHVST